MAGLGRHGQLPAQDERRWCWVLILPAADFAVKAQCCSATLLALPQPTPTFGDLEKTNQIQPTRQLWGGRPAAPYGRRTSGLTVSSCLLVRAAALVAFLQGKLLPTAPRQPRPVDSLSSEGCTEPQDTPQRPPEHLLHVRVANGEGQRSATGAAAKTQEDSGLRECLAAGSAEDGLLDHQNAVISRKKKKKEEGRTKKTRERP